MGDGIEQQETEPEGMFSAVLLPVNASVAGQVKGIVTVTKYGDDLNVRVSVKNAPMGGHIQGLYSGDNCPYEDINGDGLIDIKESERSVMQMLIPFDGDLSGQLEGNDYYPSGASYTYERSTSYRLMLSDLRRTDFRVAEMAKLPANELKLEGRVILVLGVSQNHTLPDTVATMGRNKPQATIPIACGVLSFVPDGSGPPEVEEDPAPPRSPGTYRPRPDPGPPLPPVEPYPEEEPRGGFWGRLRDRVEGWWGRLGRWWRGDSGEGAY